ncbi:helix-turn-helix domain-containing protein [Rubrobacter tropicus]|uniref:Helix-turn-helix domain-containing protein n=1 Tax=Rubrobacter tropicus TaxID=2653851 RepID=A0A6G8Q9W7_9ACTN|nr:IclR family transcriptional regulator [Rubrobacter tropicus]QIN83284.1 helix-turn-helix domain-containing protein [Rubrobacter tropicus]
MKNRDGMLAKGLSLLETLGGHPEGAGVSQVAQETSLPVSTTYRLLNELVDWGFATFDRETRRYHLGLKVFELSSRVSLTRSLSETALPVMRRLAESTGESAFLGVRTGTDALLVERVAGPGRVQVNGVIGGRTPLHRLAQGKAILAFLPKHEREEVIDRMTLEPETPKTITDKEILRRDLETTRKQGWAMVDEENEEGVRAIAAPVTDARDRPLAAIAIAAPAFRSSVRDLKAHVPLLLEAVREIELQLPPSSELVTSS